MPTFTLHEFTVEGISNFPFDMLRYDSCWPKREAEDVVNMAPFERGSLIRQKRQVTLVGIKQPTEERWESFGWKIVPDSVRKLPS